MSTPWTIRSTALAGAGMAMLALACADTAQAQEGAGGEAVTVEDVVVTATRREERLSRVPVAVTVVTGEVLRDTNLATLRDITTIVPALNFRNAASSKDQAFFIRGLGTVSTSSAVEPSVSTVIDGVVLARQGQAMLELMDIERVEVLRGPQGTLFGKNASAGVVNIVSRPPSAAPRGEIAGFYGTEGDEYRVRASVSGPLGEGLAGSLNLLYSDYGGNVRNVATGRTVNGYQREGVRGRLRFAPNADATFLLTLDFLDSEETTPTGVVTRTYRIAYPTNVRTDFPAFAAALLPVVASEDNTRINSDYETRARDKNLGAALQGDFAVGDHTLTAITGWRSWKNTQRQDQDRLSAVVTGQPAQHDLGHVDFTQFSQELRVASPQGQTVDYVLGLYYFHAADDEDYRRDTSTLAAGRLTPQTGTAAWSIVNENYSAFGEATANFSPRFRALAGFRVVHDNLRYRFQRVSTSPTPVTGIQTAFQSADSTSETGYAARLGAQFDVAERTMAYGTWSRGYKGPAYNVPFSMLAQDQLALDPETNSTFEAGLKALVADGRLAVNVAAFYSDFKNYQVNFSDIYNGSIVTRLINAGQVSSRGVEADFTARPVPALTITGAAAYIDAKIDDFTCPPGANVACDVDGKTLPFSPKWKLNVRATYRIDLSSTMQLELSSDYNWRSEVQFSINQTPDTIQNAYGIWNADVALVTADGWRAALLVKNIADESYASVLSTFGAGVVRYVPRDDRRYFGVDLRKSF